MQLHINELSLVPTPDNQGVSIAPTANSDRNGVEVCLYVDPATDTFIVDVHQNHGDEPTLTYRFPLNR